MKMKKPDLASVKDSNRAVHLQVAFIALSKEGKSDDRSLGQAGADEEQGGRGQQQGQSGPPSGTSNKQSSCTDADGLLN